MKKRKSLKIIWTGCLFALFFLVSISTNGQNTSQTTTVTLDEVSLEATKLETSRNTLPVALSILDFSKTQPMYQQLSLQEYLGAVPGLFSLNATNYAQDLRISVRGFGSRAAFGIRGIKIIVDGIPETTPDGQGQLDNLPLGALDRIEILRGPAASLYGNASGGVIYINTLDSITEESTRFRTTFGAYGLQSYQLTTQLKNKKTTALLYANRTTTDGYRGNSRLEQNVFNAKLNHQWSEQSFIQAQINYTNSPLAQDAGGLNFEEATAEPRQARQRNIDYNTYETVDQLKWGLRWVQSFGSQWKWENYGFYSLRDFYGKLPFENGGIIDLYRNYFGLGSRLSYNEQKEKVNHRWQLGIETMQQKDQRDRFKNLKGVQGALTFSQLEEFGSFGMYILDELEWKKWLLRTSLRYDHQSLGADTVEENQVYSVLNPSFGLSHEISNRHRLFVNFSTSFETPTLSELSANPSGAEGLNLNLDPSFALNYEVGWKALFSKVRLEANVFFIQSTNEILPYELEAFPGRSFYRNVGATNRFGLEAFGTYQWNQWKLEASVTQAQYVFKSTEENPNSDLNGNQLPGIPGSQFFVQLGYESLKDWQWQVSIEHIGEFYANNVNTVVIEAYQKIRFQTQKKWNLSWGSISAFGGIQNLLNAQYFDNIRLNAFGARHFEPAPGRNAFGGISIGI
ncbi:MAG: TonB-dependent receptor [Flavobacteriaceae bacterium]